MDKFEDLKVFTTVVDAGGFTAAAVKLGIVKSAVSRRVRDLEDRLGARLINRSSQKVILTEEGREFYANAARLLAELADAEDAVSTRSHSAVGLLRVSAPVSFTTHCLAPVLSTFLRANPALDVRIETDDRLVDIVNEGFDLAIRISHLNDSLLVARRIVPIRHVCCASPRYLKEHGKPKTPKDLAHHRGILYGNVDAERHWLFKDDQSTVPKTQLTMTNGDAMREAAIAGEGITMLPSFIVHEAVRRAELEVILRDFMRPPIAMHAVHPSRRNVSRKTRLFIDFLVECFGERPFWDRDLFPELAKQSAKVAKR